VHVIAAPKRFYLALGGGACHKADEADVKKNIHSRVTEALHSLSEPARTQDSALFEENSTRSLYDLPIVTHFEKDAGAFITSSIVFTENQENGNQNQSTHRLISAPSTQLQSNMQSQQGVKQIGTLS
jgi:2,5-furandicarboxylate decarboxylase 1